MNNRLKLLLALFFVGILVQSCYQLQKSQDFDTTGSIYSKYTMAEYLNSDRNEFTVFAQAAAHCGLTDDMTASPGKTYVVPTDEAFLTFLATYGIEKVTDIHPVVLKDFLLYLQIPANVKSTGMAAGETVPYITGSGKPIYISRNDSGSNPYLLLVNTVYPEGVEPLGGPSATVTMQDVFFKDNTAQVVDAVPYYAPIVESPDTFTGELESDKILRIDTNIDTYIYNHAGFDTPQSSKIIVANSERFPVIWFYKKDLGFEGEICKATLNIYRSYSKNEGVVDSDFTLHDVSDQLWDLTSQGTDESALLNAVVATYLPEMGLDNLMATFTPAETRDTWFNIDITQYITKYYAQAGTERIPIGVSMMPVTPFYTSTGLLPLGWKNNSTGSTVNNPAYIKVMGPVESKTVLVNNKTLECGALSHAAFSNNVLLRKASDDAGELDLQEKNITYSLETLPSHGTVTVNGIPLAAGQIFNQSQIAAGVVSYYNTESCTEDSFDIKGSDYTGSVVADPIQFKVSVR